MASFSVYKRGKSGVYYARLKNPLTGKYTTAKSTGTSDVEKARYVAQKWLYEGIPDDKTDDFRTADEVFSIDEILTKLKGLTLKERDVQRFVDLFEGQGYKIGSQVTTKSNIDFVDYLAEFWDFDRSRYVQEKLSFGHRMTRSHTSNMLSRVNSYWRSYFGHMNIDEVTPIILKEFTAHLSTLTKTDQKGNQTDTPLSPQTKNHIIKAGSIALKWAYENSIIDSNPAANLRKYAMVRKERGILTDQEVEQLFSMEWVGNPANKICNMLASQTGLRLGEIVALRVQDIQDDRILIRHSWSELDGLKSTKTGECRQVPLLPEMREILLSTAKQNPYGFHSNGFVFWALDSFDRPMRDKNVSDSLKKALMRLGIENEARIERGICFHSWRHYYSKKMADSLSERAMKLTGHKTAKVFEVYAGHQAESDFMEAMQATKQTFGTINSANLEQDESTGIKSDKAITAP